MMQRRQWLHASAALGCGALGLSVGQTSAWAQGMVSGRLRSLSEMLAPWRQGAAPVRQAVHLQLPLLADNGHLVPLNVRVDSPMTEADHVQEIVLVSQRNPVERMATFHVGPWSGRAEVSTRVRLAGSQMVLALARMSWPDRVVVGDVFKVRILVQHPMETGYLQDNEGRTVPRNVIQTLSCQWVGEGAPPQEVFRVEPSSGISANPLFEFYLRATRSGELWLRWIDDAGQMGQLRQVLTVLSA